MFHFNELEIDTHPEVYDPAEDTFLLLDAIEIKKGDSVFEIGAGCGVISLFCAQQGSNVLCSDINPIAIDLIMINYQKNKSKIIGNFSVRKGDLFTVLKTDEKFDVIIFNPPYLPTKKVELVGGFFDKAVNGGKDGLNVIKRFIKGLSKHLKINGKAYFVFSSLSDKNMLHNIISKNGLKEKVVASKTFNDETLEVYLLKKY
jgi:release factor glutamine methyltransferase